MLLLWLDRKQAHPYLGALQPSLWQVSRRKGDGRAGELEVGTDGDISLDL